MTQYVQPPADCVQSSAPATAAAVTEAAGRHHLLRATTWRRHGCLALAATAAATFIACHAHDAEDTVHAYAQLALIAHERSGAQLLLAGTVLRLP